MTLPTPTAATPTTRYIPAGVRRYIWVPTIADKSAPTSAELTAGTDLTTEVASVSGFDVQTNNVEVPDAGSRYTSKVPGRISSNDSSLTLYMSEDSTDLRSLLTQDLAGFVVIAHEGLVASGKMDVFPVRIAAVTKSEDIEAAATMDVMVTITSQPAVDLAVPSA